MKPPLSTALIACALVGLVRPACAADAPAAELPPTEVVQFSHGKVDHTFATGGALLVNNLYKVQAGRRVAPGVVEIHTADTDIFYIVEGTAKFVTGGTPLEPKDTGPGEIRAKSIIGGTEHTLTKGDVIVIPHGTPHQFTVVDATFLYFVVKVTQ